MTYICTRALNINTLLEYSYVYVYTPPHEIDVFSRHVTKRKKNYAEEWRTFFFLFIFNVNKYKNLSVQYRRTGARTIRWGRGIEESEKERENSQWRSRGYYYLYFLCIHTLYFYAVESKELNANVRVYGVTAVVHKYTIKSLPNERDLSACIEVCRRIKIKKNKNIVLYRRVIFYMYTCECVCVYVNNDRINRRREKTRCAYTYMYINAPVWWVVAYFILLLFRFYEANSLWPYYICIIYIYVHTFVWR